MNNYLAKIHSCRTITATLALTITSLAYAGDPSPRIIHQAYRASSDNRRLPIQIYAPPGIENRPLLISLDKWSGDATQGGNQGVYTRWCSEKKWNFIHPYFRGPQKRPWGEKQLVQDVMDAVEFMKKNYWIDENRIYLVGVCHGGYAALLMAAREPDIWAGVSAWAPVSDMYVWWKQADKDPGEASKYARSIETILGGRPDKNQEAAEDCITLSPVTYLSNARRVNLDISAGVTDGHQGGPVPFTQSLYAFNAVAAATDQIDPKLAETFFAAQKLPKGLAPAKQRDPLYGNKKVIFRKTNGNTRVTIFQGKHELIHQAALNWLDHQRRDRPAAWNFSTGK